jgi:hypothetical protein
MAEHEPQGIWRIIDKLQSGGGVAAVLAVGITGTICLRYLFFQDAADLPPVLEHSLSVILGFYFGSKVTRSQKHSSN